MTLTLGLDSELGRRWPESSALATVGVTVGVRRARREIWGVTSLTAAHRRPVSPSPGAARWPATLPRRRDRRELSSVGGGLPCDLRPERLEVRKRSLVLEASGGPPGVDDRVKVRDPNDKPSGDLDVDRIGISLGEALAWVCRPEGQIDVSVT